ncbi:MAG: protease HtpX [Neisseria sp.]|nr:protease HtpX [Neisseria sp.]
MKRIFLFLLTNLAALATMGVLWGMAGIGRHGGMAGVLACCAALGFAGSIVSLLAAKPIAKKAVGARVLGEPADELEAWLLKTVAAQARQWDVAMPEVAVYPSPAPNAFATGASRNHSLVAVSTGLLEQLNRNEAEAVLAHEIAHIGNGDMVTLALIQGVLNTFVVFLSHFAAKAAAAVVWSKTNSSRIGGAVYLAVSAVLQLLFGLPAALIVMWFSRRREYRADAVAARLVGVPNMLSALQRLKDGAGPLPGEISVLGIAGGKPDSPFMASHPSLDSRIARLKRL